MAERHILLLVIRIIYLGLCVSACGSRNNERNEVKSNTDMINPIIGNEAKKVTDFISSRASNIASNVMALPKILDSASKGFNHAASHYATPDVTNAVINTPQESYLYDRYVRTMARNGKIDSTNNNPIVALPYNFNHRNDVINSRIRRSEDDYVQHSTTDQPAESDLVSTWPDFFSSFLRETNIEDLKKRDANEQSPSSQTIYDSNQFSDEDTSMSHEKFKSATEFFDLLRQQLPQFFQRLKVLQRLISNPINDEDIIDLDSSSTYTNRNMNFDDLYDEIKMSDQLEKPSDEASTEDSIFGIKLSKNPIKQSVEQDDVKMLDHRKVSASII